MYKFLVLPTLANICLFLAVIENLSTYSITAAFLVETKEDLTIVEKDVAIDIRINLGEKKK